MEEIYKTVAIKLGYPEDLIKFVGNHATNHFRVFMKEIPRWQYIINKFGVLEPMYKKVKRFCEVHEGKEHIDLTEYHRIKKLGEQHFEQQKINGKKRQAKKRHADE